MRATAPVNAGGARFCVVGAAVLAGAVTGVEVEVEVEVEVDVVCAVVVGGRDVVVTRAGRTAFDAPGDPHAPVATSIAVSSAPTNRPPRTTS